MKYKLSIQTVNTFFPDAKWLHIGNDLVGVIIDDDVNMLIVIKDATVPSEGGAWEYDMYTMPDDFKETHLQTLEIPDREPDATLPGYFAPMNNMMLTLLNENIQVEEDTRPIVVAIVGESGSGKTILSRELENKYSIYNIISYTTRDMRPGETDGVEHWFVKKSDMPERKDMLAYTYFGNNHYWAAMKDIEDKKAATYVIDEAGVIDLYELAAQRKIRVIWVEVTRPDNPTDVNRKNRDVCRDEAKTKLKMMHRSPDVYIENNYETVEDFLNAEAEELACFINSL